MPLARACSPTLAPSSSTIPSMASSRAPQQPWRANMAPSTSEISDLLFLGQPEQPPLKVLRAEPVADAWRAGHVAGHRSARLSVGARLEGGMCPFEADEAWSAAGEWPSHHGALDTLLERQNPRSVHLLSEDVLWCKWRMRRALDVWRRQYARTNQKVFSKLAHNAHRKGKRAQTKSAFDRWTATCDMRRRRQMRKLQQVADWRLSLLMSPDLALSPVRQLAVRWTHSLTYKVFKAWSAWYMTAGPLAPLRTSLPALQPRGPASVTHRQRPARLAWQDGQDATPNFGEARGCRCPLQPSAAPPWGARHSPRTPCGALRPPFSGCSHSHPWSAAFPSVDPARRSCARDEAACRARRQAVAACRDLTGLSRMG